MKDKLLKAFIEMSEKKESWKLLQLVARHAAPAAGSLICLDLS